MSDQNHAVDAVHTLRVQQLFVQHQARLRTFVLSLAPDFSAANDVLQETFLTVTRKAAEFELGTKFLAWARRIATFKVLALARDRQRRPVRLADDVVRRMDEVTRAVRWHRIAELSEDYLSAVRAVAKTEAHLEAPAIFNRHGAYYWLASGVAWWYSSDTSWSMARKLEGPWIPWKIISSRDPRYARDCEFDSYNAQHDFVVPVKGSEAELFLFCGDRYTQFTTRGVGRNVMTPCGISPKDGNETVSWQQSWWVDAAKGTCSKRKEQEP